jgi:hypothetical protein
MRRVYGISLSEYEQMLNEQHDVCKICERPPSTRSLAVDHCHATGKVRGILCHRCNTALGSVDDNVGILTKLIDYLEQHK